MMTIAPRTLHPMVVVLAALVLAVIVMGIALLIAPEILRLLMKHRARPARSTTLTKGHPQ